MHITVHHHYHMIYRCSTRYLVECTLSTTEVPFDSWVGFVLGMSVLIQA